MPICTVRRALGACVAVALTALSPLKAQVNSPPDAYIAFRADADHVVATLFVRDARAPMREGESAEPVARLGYPYFDLPDTWINDFSGDHPVGERWAIHAGAGRVLDATVERHIGGYLGCNEGIGVLLRITPGQPNIEAVSRTRYFVAMPGTSDTPPALSRSPVRALAASTVSPQTRRAIESTLSELLARELPRVRTEAAPDLKRMLDAEYRQERLWAQSWLRIEDAMARGEGRLEYDVQPFNLSPDGVPVVFVRATWLVGTRQGFGATLWARAGKELEVLETNVDPASWMRMSLFRNGIVPVHMGLILNVFDRDGDGLGEVLLVNEGYESRVFSLLEYSSNRFTPVIQLAGGC
jgi:hypothetical protein